MASKILSYVPLVNRLVPGGPGGGVKEIKLEPVEVHNVETAPDRRPRTLKHLLRGNHVNHSVIYHDLRFHNHAPHILCSAYLLGADSAKLHEIYDVESKTLEPWVDSPQEIVKDDWRDFLGDGRYQRAYVDFFEDNVTFDHSYDWKKVVEEYMFGGEEPLVNCLIGGLSHPLIHLGYAYEMNNREIAMEALAMTAVSYNFLHKYTDDKSYTRPAPFSSTHPAELLERLRKDSRFDRLFKDPGFGNIKDLFDDHEDLLLEYWNAWAVTEDDPVRQFRESQELAADLLVATVAPATHSYNFFVVHLLTSSHAVRILLPFIPVKFHVSLVRQWWLLVLSVYIAVLRPKIDRESIPKTDKNWSYVEEKAISSRWSTDAHYVKACRALKEAARTWGDVHERYLNAAVRFVDDFEGWVFGDAVLTAEESWTF